MGEITEVKSFQGSLTELETRGSISQYTDEEYKRLRRKADRYLLPLYAFLFKNFQWLRATPGIYAPKA